MQLTLGSLFSGSGGFELAALLCDIRPVWAAEIEPFPIRVTTKRFPKMLHLGDVCHINGANIPPVDIISFGSPCTNLSLAGKREGLSGKQSSLFFEAIRIIREMRKESNGTKPRYIICENVPGAMSSGKPKGEDFRQVLTEICRIAEPEAAEVPAPPATGWPPADVLVGDGWSVAYRTLDAQHFGLAQRRRRIYLVADFGSERAADLLFERESMRRDFKSSLRAWKDSARDFADSVGTAVAFDPTVCAQLGGHTWNNITDAPQVDMSNNQTAIAFGICSKDSNAMRSANSNSGVYQAALSKTLDTHGSYPACNQGGMAICIEGNGTRPSHKGSGASENISFTLNTIERHAVAYSLTMGGFPEVHEEQASTLMARDFKSPQVVNQPQYIVRKLTPKECAMLQGFPEWWCDELELSNPSDVEMAFWRGVFDTYARINGKKPRSDKQIRKWLANPHTDGAEWKLWGNGIALPCALFVLRGIVEQKDG